MQLEIEDPQMADLLERLSEWTGESPAEALERAVAERLDRLVANDQETYIARIRAITSRVAAMPALDTRTAEEIIGYNENGHFD
jgi:antitoxin VapB